MTVFTPKFGTGAGPSAMNALTGAPSQAYGVGHIEIAATPARIWSAVTVAAR